MLEKTTITIQFHCTNLSTNENSSSITMESRTQAHALFLVTVTFLVKCTSKYSPVYVRTYCNEYLHCTYVPHTYVHDLSLSEVHLYVLTVNIGKCSMGTYVHALGLGDVDISMGVCTCKPGDMLSELYSTCPDQK